MSRDTSFYYSFLVLPPRKRQAIIAVWDFCRAVDDAVDEPESGGEPARVAAATGARTAARLTPPARARAAQELEHWRRELDAAFSGTPSTPQGIALQPYIREFGLPRQPFDDLIEGVEMDLNRARYDTFDALSEYCRRVASTVGLICVEIFGYRDPRTREYAVTLGLALQLTNIIRDVSTDFACGRVYLPLEDLRRFSVNEADLATGSTPAVRDLLRFECARARHYYRAAAAQLPKVDARSMVAAEIMGAIYFGILQRIERANYDVFTARIRVPRPVRAVIALKVWVRTLLTGAAAPSTTE